MTLSEYEQRVLVAIETGCRAEDPGLAARLDLVAAHTRRARTNLFAQCAIWLGSVVFVIGAGTARGPVSAGVVVAAYGVVMIVAGVLGWVRNRTHQAGHGRSGRIR